MSKKRILIISTQPRVLAQIKKGLMEHFEIGIASAAETALSALHAQVAHAIVLYITGESGLELTEYQSVCEYAGIKKIPVLFLAEKDNQHDEAAAFNMGAADYCLNRPGIFNALVARLNLRIGVKPMPSTESLLAGKTILIAEDVELNRQIIAAILSDIKDLNIDFARNGLEAVEKFRQRPEDYLLLFMDINMPELDGLQATRQIRLMQSKSAREIPIIALTASNSDKDIESFMQAGMDGYVGKPVDYQAFMQAIITHCDL